MTDDELHAQAYLYVVGAIDPDEVREFEAHLAGCADCRKEVAAMNEVTAHISQTVAADPPPALRSAVLAEIAQTAQDPAAPPARGGLGRHAARVGHSEHRRETAADVVAVRRPWRERIPLLVAAAAVLAAVGVAGWAINDRTNARDDATAAQRLADQLTTVLNSGDAQSVSNQTKTGAVTTVLRSQSRGVALLLASDLPALPDDKTYQAWTIDNGNPTSAGTFESQGAETTYQLPDAAVQTSTVAITVEDAGGADAPTTDPIVALSLS